MKKIIIVLFCFISFHIMSEDKDLDVQQIWNGSVNENLLDIEKKFSLPPPIDVRWPSRIDPMWWFVYYKNGMRVEIAVNGENIKVFDFLLGDKRKNFWGCGFCWISQDSTDFRRYSPNKRYAKTTPLAVAFYSQTTKDSNYFSYLNSLNLYDFVSIDRIEKDLALPKPLIKEPPAFINPMFVFGYKTDDFYSITLYASLDPESGEYIFAGYWKIVPIAKERDPKG